MLLNKKWTSVGGNSPTPPSLPLPTYAADAAVVTAVAVISAATITIVAVAIVVAISIFFIAPFYNFFEKI